MTWEVHQVHQSPTKSYPRAPGKFHDVTDIEDLVGFMLSDGAPGKNLDRSFYDFYVIQSQQDEILLTHGL